MSEYEVVVKFNGKNIPVTIDTSSDVVCFKAQLESLTGVPVENQKSLCLFFVLFSS